MRHSLIVRPVSENFLWFLLLKSTKTYLLPSHKILNKGSDQIERGHGPPSRGGPSWLLRTRQASHQPSPLTHQRSKSIMLIDRDQPFRLKAWLFFFFFYQNPYGMDAPPSMYETGPPCLHWTWIATFTEEKINILHVSLSISLQEIFTVPFHPVSIICNSGQSHVKWKICIKTRCYPKLMGEGTHYVTNPKFKEKPYHSYESDIV